MNVSETSSESDHQKKATRCSSKDQRAPLLGHLSGMANAKKGENRGGQALVVFWLFYVADKPSELALFSLMARPSRVIVHKGLSGHRGQSEPVSLAYPKRALIRRHRLSQVRRVSDWCHHKQCADRHPNQSHRCREMLLQFSGTSLVWIGWRYHAGAHLGSRG